MGEIGLERTNRE
jgi:hypothetical protein